MSKKKEWNAWNHCEKKIGYRSKRSARNAIKAMAKSGHIMQDAEIYKCVLCKKYHLGHRRVK